ncbi:hypothetical protein EK21DRAFT_111384 [Setomelanomma holmii]|uniref:Uncharacterized protein n=1 Tax=Setomelanomma holmii TaxID=210430 RepID=A0A9P4LN70_9PLEO|nr:hypothetical protein EK21DRAFT_111384 [Setomelanomma holmii]
MVTLREEQDSKGYDAMDDYWNPVPIVLQISPQSAGGRLRRLVWLHCDAACADPRVKIYGLLNLAALKPEDGELNERLLLEVDYKKTVEAVFSDFVEKMITDAARPFIHDPTTMPT